MTIRTAACSMLLAATTLAAHTSAPRPSAPLSVDVPAVVDMEGLFSKDVMTDLLRSDECVEVRFYTAQRTTDPKTATVIAIGVDKDGKEIDKLFQTTPYRMYSGLNGNTIMVDKLSAGKASKACKNYSNSGEKSFAASISKSELDVLLKYECAGVQLTTTKRGEHTIFLMTAVNIVDGKAVPAGDGDDYTRLSTDPCPPACGEDPRPSYYLEMKEASR
jgi:hypothetical protein